MNSYVALGDSLTAGNGCDPGTRWADLLADRIGRDRPGFRYVNLGIDGATSSAVLDQVPVAIAHRPDLVTLICGANDVLLSTRPDLEGFRTRFDLMFRHLKRSVPGAMIVTSTYPEGWNHPGIGHRTRRRIDRGMADLNRAIIEISAEWSALCLDVTDHPGISDPGNFSSDGLHPSASGHREAAAEFEEAIAGPSGIPSRKPGNPIQKWRFA